MRQWKVALSLAIIAAMIGPFVTGAWEKRAAYEETWVPLTADQKAAMSSDAERTNNCEAFVDPPRIRRTILDNETMCRENLEILRNGGYYKGHFDTSKYFAQIATVALAAFGVVFALAMVIPALTRRYWAWLNR